MNNVKVKRLDRDAVKEWLKIIGKSREDLSHDVGVSLHTMNGYLSSGKPVPPQIIDDIEMMMDGRRKLIIELPLENYERLESALNLLGYGCMSDLGEYIVEKFLEDLAERL